MRLPMRSLIIFPAPPPPEELVGGGGGGGTLANDDVLFELVDVAVVPEDVVDCPCF